MNDQMFDSLNRKVTELNRKLESLMTNANKQIAMILALSRRATLGMFQWKGRHHGFEGLNYMHCWILLAC